MNLDVVRVLRVTPDLVEFAFTDTRHATLQHDLHMIMTNDTRGLYMFNIMHAVAATSISEGEAGRRLVYDAQSSQLKSIAHLLATLGSKRIQCTPLMSALQSASTHVGTVAP